MASLTNNVISGALYFAFCVLMLCGAASGTIYISDHFDSQSDWDGCTDPPSPWASYSWSSGTYCNHAYIGGGWDDAHGSTGKSVKFVWHDTIREMGMGTWDAGNLGYIWTGYWWRHNSGYTMPEQDKWIYFPEVNGQRMMISHFSNTISFFDGATYSLKVNIGSAANQHPDTSHSSWYNDETWHYFVIFASPVDGDIRIWRDGTELTWDGDNLDNVWSGTSFDSSMLEFGYQCRNGWLGHESYFDDIIVASTQSEVDDFLGLPSGGSGAPDPTGIANTTGMTWANHTWNAGSGNITDSYNVSVNSVWYNTSSNEYYNDTGLSAGAWSNITVFAFNNTDGISTGGVSQDVQTSQSDTILSANQFSACNAWNSVQSFTQIDNDVNNLIGMSWYNHTSGWWESYMSGRSYNSNNDIPENCSVFMFVNAVTSVSTPSTVNEITIVSGDWFYGYLPGEVDKTLSEIETEMNTDGLDVWHISAYNGTARSYTSAGDYSISPRGGFRVHCNVTGAFTI